jgi:hypothetical protein
VGKWSQKSGLRHRPQISRKLISYIERYDLGRYDAIVMGKDYTPFEKQDTRIAAFDSQNRSLYEVQKEILCIPYQKNITCWLMS